MSDQLNLTQLAALYGDNDKAREKLEQLRWPNGASCPHCESENVYRLTPKSDSKTAGRKGLWKCSKCRKQFTVTVNTIFEGSRIPLGKWIMAIYLICSSKKGMSALQLMRMLWPEDAQAKTPSGQWKKTHYKTAWFMAHRIRYAMSQEPLFSKLNGTVEADESYFGGKLKNMHREQRQIAKDAGAAHKAPVVTLVERNGRVKTRHMEHVTSNNMKEMLQEYVAHPETFLNKDILVDLYITKQLPRYRVAKELGVNSRRVNAMLKQHGIKLRTGQPERRKHPELANLKVGDAVTINAEGLRKNFHVSFYQMAKRLGIRVSVKRVDGETVRVTRVG